jgi:tagatose-6-phosphate ketose/aldose isomerase
LIKEHAMEGLLALCNASEQEKEARGTRYTPHEIGRQPESWQKTYQICSDLRSSLVQFLRASGIGTGQASPTTVFLVGAGTSDYIGRTLAPLLQKLWGCDVRAVPSTDLLTNSEDFIFAHRSYLWISFSRSGDSSEGLAVLEATVKQYPKVRHLLVTCNAGSRMAVMCRKTPDRAFVLALDDTANDHGLAMTSSFTNMVVAGHCLAHLFSPADYETTFSVLREAGKEFLERAQEVALTIAKKDFKKACFVGSGSLAAVGKESALKVLELTAGRIHTMSESTLGLRHGPMSALDGDTLVVSFLSQDTRRRNYELDLLKEVRKKQLGKLRVVVTPAATDDLAGFADHVLSLHAPGLNDEYRAPVDVMLAQLLGLFCSLRLGLQPDSPSPNGAISRVVSHLNIYTSPTPE